MSPWQYVKALGLPVFNVAFAGGWLVYEVATDQQGWVRAVFVPVFAVLVALAVWQVPRSYYSYRRMVESERALGAQRARFLRVAIRKGLPVEVILRVDRMIMEDAPMEDVLAILAEHRR